MINKIILNALRIVAITMLPGLVLQAQNLGTNVNRNQTTRASTEVTIKDPSFVIGALIASEMVAKFEKQGYEIDRESMIRGFTSQIIGDLEGRHAELQKAFKIIAEKNEQQNKLALQKQLDENLLMSQNFLLENAKKEGVTAMDSGVQFEVIQAGFGEQPKTNDTVICYIKAHTFSGSLLNDDFSSGKPTRFVVGQATSALAECLPAMRRGALWRIVAPPDKVYGESGLPPHIPGNMGIMYEVELLQFSSQVNNIEKSEPPNSKEGSRFSKDSISLD